MREPIYLATNGEDYEWNVYAVFATRQEAERYVELFTFPKVVEEWRVGVPQMPMEDAAVTSWTCSYNWEGKDMQCHEGAMYHRMIGKLDGWKGKNRGTSVYARDEQEAKALAQKIIEGRDGPIYG